MKKIILLSAFFLLGNFANADFSPENWGIQKSNFKIGVLEKAEHDVLILSAQKENGDFWTAEEIERIKKDGKKVLASFPIANISFGHFAFEKMKGIECDDSGYTKFWNPKYMRFDYKKNCRENNLLGEEFSDQGSTFGVPFWTEEWKNFVLDPTLEKILEANFDGIFLEKTSDFEIWGENTKEIRYADEMAMLIIGLTNKIREKKENFLVIPSEASGVLKRLDPKTRMKFLDAIDGMAEISLFFDTSKKSRFERFVSLRKYFIPSKKPLFLLEFSDEKNIEKLKKWRDVFAEIGLPTILFRAENNGDLDEIPAPF